MSFMTVRSFINKRFTLATFITALVLFILSLAGNDAANDSTKVAEKFGRRVSRRVALLDKYVAQAMETPQSELACVSETYQSQKPYRVSFVRCF